MPKLVWHPLNQAWHPPNPRLAHPKVGGGGGGSGQSLAWPIPSQCATHTKTTRAWLPHGPIPPQGGIGGQQSNWPSAWGQPSGTWLCAKIQSQPSGLVIVPSGAWYTICLTKPHKNILLRILISLWKMKMGQQQMLYNQLEMVAGYPLADTRQGVRIWLWMAVPPPKPGGYPDIPRDNWG
jgi:hypothetical protein